MGVIEYCAMLQLWCFVLDILLHLAALINIVLSITQEYCRQGVVSETQIAGRSDVFLSNGLVYCDLVTYRKANCITKSYKIYFA